LRLRSFYKLTRYAHPQKGRLSALWFAGVVLRRIRRRERQEGKLPIRFQ
jgi:hypothetical protein